MGGGLHDIHGIDPVSWWPPAPGWWLLGLLLLGLLWLGFRLWRLRVLRREEWRLEAYRRLVVLRRGLRGRDAKRSAAELSELLRRIAMIRCRRQDCAGLVGDEWLVWLRANDPAGFDWPRRGALLKGLPYAPDSQGVDARKLRPLVNAAMRWVVSYRVQPGALRSALMQREDGRRAV